MVSITPKCNRRNLFLDIETIPNSYDDPEGALSALRGRIVCIGLLIDDGLTIMEHSLINENEKQILQDFWTAVRPNDVFVGHNILAFDLPFIRQRCWIDEVKPSRKIDLRRYYTQQVLDTQQLFSVWGTTRYPKLNDLGDALGCGNKIGGGNEVATWWQNGELEKIGRYCRQDLRITFKVFTKMMFWPVPDRFIQLECAEPLTRLNEIAPSREDVVTKPSNLIVFPKWRSDPETSTHDNG